MPTDLKKEGSPPKLAREQQLLETLSTSNYASTTSEILIHPAPIQKKPGTEVPGRTVYHDNSTPHKQQDEVKFHNLN